MAWTDHGEIHVQKVPSTPDENTRAFLEGLSGLAAAGGFASADVTSINHGTTVALGTA
jgi:N-methylhydantoinase A/oxoprolinase/acetone carboxylase beta subunit